MFPRFTIVMVELFTDFNDRAFGRLHLMGSHAVPDSSVREWLTTVVRWSIRRSCMT